MFLSGVYMAIILFLTYLVSNIAVVILYFCE